MTNVQFRPFGDDETCVTVDGISIENGTSEVAMFGDIVFRRGDGCLEKVRTLIDHLKAIEKALEAETVLSPEATPAVDEVSNPF